MLTFISLFIAIIVFGFLTNLFNDKDSIFVVPAGVGLGLVVIMIFVVMFSIFGSMVDMPSDIAKMNQTYNSLVYQLENIDTIYGNSRANDKKALYDDIQEWNETIARGRVKHNSLWLNWMNPIDYDQFELIKLTK